tara:strand:- start:4241 stop:4702 length:462 start_codon:yes stop_codon:yes gene_type:complete
MAFRLPGFGEGRNWQRLRFQAVCRRSGAKLSLPLDRLAGVAMKLTTAQGITLSNTETIPGKQIVEFYGVVTGNTVRAKHIGKDILAGLKNIVGGELKAYTELLQDSRLEATERMVKQAESMGANAVVNVRFATSSIAQGASELFAYGTAVRVR